MKTRILFLRHGQSVANTEKYFAGHLDVPLTELGKKQAEEAAATLRDLYVDKIFSSPLSRAYDTALPFAKDRGLSITKLDGFIEWYAGKLEGLSFEEFKKQYPEEKRLWDEDAFNLDMPDGEHARDFIKRVGTTLDALAEEVTGLTVLVACHGGVIKAIPSYLAGMDANLFNTTPVPNNCSITEVVYEDGKGEIVRFSDDSHLGEYKSETFII